MALVPVTVPSDLLVYGNISGATMTIPASTIYDAAVNAAADIAATKCEQQYTWTYADKDGVDATSHTRRVFYLHGATGTVISLIAGSTAVAGAATTVTVDLHRSVTATPNTFATMCSSVITLDNTSVVGVMQSASFSTTSLVAGDCLKVVVTLTGANEPTGMFIQLRVRHDA